MIWVAGVDGCRAGWFVVLHDMAAAFNCVCVPCFSQVLALQEQPSVVAVDIPIGLLTAAVPGGRDCDRMSRSLLGSLRGRSVFSAPVRGALAATTFSEANAMNRASSTALAGVSLQCFNIFLKLREVDAQMTPALQARVREVHPEVSFYELNGRTPLAAGKKTPAGRQRRVALLQREGFGAVAAAITAHSGAHVAADDVVDAFVTCWTAKRIHQGIAISAPPTPALDARGLRMEILR
jgi:predicted RNase H-like nuclease